MQRLSLFSILLLLVVTITAQNITSNNNHPEIVGERSMYAKVYLKGNGVNEAVISSAPVHYKKNGQWEEINTVISSISGGCCNKNNVIQSFFPNQAGSSGIVKFIINDLDTISIHSKKELVLTNSLNTSSIIPVNFNNPTVIISSNTVKYEEIYSGINDEYNVLNGEIKNNIILSSFPALLNNVTSGYFGFQETLELPLGWKITSSNGQLDSLTASPLFIVDANGHSMLTIPQPLCFGKKGLKAEGSGSVEGKYLINHIGDVWTIATLVPVAWLKDVNTEYPVTIDPTVVIAGTTGGWQSPNNFVDNPGFVFIGVCCGNLTHRAWIKFNISAIPSTSCITNVEIQPNVTTVANTTAELVFINDVTGAFGPYGAINAAAYNDFGNGNYTSFTIVNTGLYGYYSLGASANALLQSQIPGGWFQVAFQFSNEPSTNYKIITATTSNLRVTYAAPPCAVLPIELQSFDAKCENGKVNISWTTASQTDNDYFTIERTIDGINYEIVGTVDGAGNSNKSLHYSYNDSNPINGTSYYSLKQTDNNGQSKHLNLVAVNCNKKGEFFVYPNPSSGTFYLEGVVPDDEIVVTDLIGQIVFKTKAEGKRADSNLTRIELADVFNGIYFIKVISKEGIISKKILISK